VLYVYINYIVYIIMYVEINYFSINSNKINKVNLKIPDRSRTATYIPNLCVIKMAVKF